MRGDGRDAPPRPWLCSRPWPCWLTRYRPAGPRGAGVARAYQWECNIRAATVVGLVSAGGIGQDLVIALKLFRYAEAGTLVPAVVALILAVDGFSRLVRRRLGAAS